MKKLGIALLFMATVTCYAQEKIVQNSIKGMLAYNQGQVESLAETFTQEQYDWQPSDGVRSTGETILHIAGSNYYLASKLGFPPPEDVDMKNIEKIEGKQNIIAALKKSNAFILEKIDKIESENFAEEVDFGFGKFNRLSGLLIILEHNGEHKGQLIAYARSNGVTPPWSE